MHLDLIHKQILKVVLVALIIAMASPIFSQVVPAATEAGMPVSAGGGMSNFDVDWEHSRMEGFTLWVDFRPPYLPHMLNGLGIELEARDISFNHGDKPASFRQDTGGGGVIYEWRHYRNFKPYVKGLMSFGSIDFGECLANCSTVPYMHDTRSVYAPGLGFEYHAWRHVWVRADYEYQFWPQLTGSTYLNPQGFTLGAMYDFRTRNRP